MCVAIELFQNMSVLKLTSYEQLLVCAQYDIDLMIYATQIFQRACNKSGWMAFVGAMLTNRLLGKSLWYP